MNLVGSVIGALFFDGAVFNIITVTSLHRAPLSPAGCDFFIFVEKPACDFFNATFGTRQKKSYSINGVIPDLLNMTL